MNPSVMETPPFQLAVLSVALQVCYREVSLVIPIVQTGKLRQREVKNKQTYLQSGQSWE